MNAVTIEKEQVFAGDVLLCYSSMMDGEAQAEGIGYSHVAIALKDQRVSEATPSGVRISDLAHLLDEYDHIAVLRNPELWDQERLAQLEHFAAEQCGKKFNMIGMGRFPSKKEKHLASLPTRIAGYFEGTEPEVADNREAYFCSELITAAFIHVGIIHPSAAIVFSPEVFSPSDIGSDKAFGFFQGYLVPYAGYRIPEDDHFRNSI